MQGQLQQHCKWAQHFDMVTSSPRSLDLYCTPHSMHATAPATNWDDEGEVLIFFACSYLQKRNDT